MITLTSLSTEYVTVLEVAEGVGVSWGTARAILESTGTGQPIGNMKVYSRAAAKAAVAEKYEKVLEFLGYPVSPFGAADA